MGYKIKILDNKKPNVIPNSYRDDINDKVHPIDRNLATAEVERGEIIYNPSTGILLKAGGSKHSKGGTPVNPESGAFIFSDFKDTSLNKQDIKQMEFKSGGTYKPKSNTPAKVLNRQIDIIHHNHLVNITQNPKKHDAITKNSAEWMLKKNLDTIGQMAFKQEQKKQFPNGQPEFSQGTAPVYSPETKQDINQAEQYKPLSYSPYMDKYRDGGNYIPKYEMGAEMFDSKTVKCRCGVQADGITCIPCTDTKIFENELTTAPKVTAFSPGYNSIYKKADGTQLGVQYTPGVKSTKAPYKGPLATNKVWSAWKKTPNGIAYTANLAKEKAGEQPSEAYQQIVPTIPPVVIPLPATAPLVGAPAGVFSPKTQGTTYDTPLTPWQKINIGLPLIQAASVQTLRPIRQHEESLIPKLDMMNDQPMLNQVNQSYFNAAQQNRLNTNPAMAISGNEELTGNRMDKLNEVIGNVINQNNTLSNKEKEINANTLNTDAKDNRVYDKTYHDDSNRAIQNTIRMKDYLNNKALTNANETIAAKLAFDSALNSQKQHPTTEVVNQADVLKGAQPIYRSRALYEANPNFFGLTTSYTPNMNINFQNLAGTIKDGTNINWAHEIATAQTLYDNSTTTADRTAALKNKTALMGLYLKSIKQNQ